MAVNANDPTNQENDQNSMNIQGNAAQSSTIQPQTQQTAQPAQSAATVGGQSSDSGEQSPTKPKKGVGSGMYSNLSKYKEANKAQTQKMASAAGKNVQNQAANVQAGLAKKKQQFQTNVAGEQARLGAGQEFATGLISQAAGQRDITDLERQQVGVQDRLDQFGDIKDTGYQTDIDANLAAQQTQAQQLADLQATQATSQGSFDPAQEAYNQALQNQLGIEDLNQTSYQVENPNYQTGSYDTTTLELDRQGYIDHTLAQKQKEIDQLKQQQNDAGYFGQQPDPLKAERIAELEGQLGSFGTAQTDLGTAQTNLDAAKQAYDQGVISRDELAAAGKSFEDQQRLYTNRGNIQEEMSALQNKIDTAPESVTPEELQRFEALRMGTGQFQDLETINVGGEAQRARTLENLASRINSSKGQGQLIRDVVGRPDYTRGQSALDTFLIGSDKQAREGLIRDVRGATEGLSDQVSATQRGSADALGKLRDQARGIQEGIGTGLTTAETGITESIAERLASGEGSALKDIQARMASGSGLTSEQMQALGLDKDANLYGADFTDDQYDVSQYGASDFTRMEDIARANALASLGGRVDQTLITDSDVIRKRIESGGQTVGDQAAMEAMRGELQGYRDQYSDVAAGKTASGSLDIWTDRYNQIRDGGLSHYNKGEAMRSLLGEMQQTAGTGDAARSYQDAGDQAQYDDFMSKYFGGDARTVAGESAAMQDLERKQFGSTDTIPLQQLASRDWQYYKDN